MISYTEGVDVEIDKLTTNKKKQFTYLFKIIINQK